MKRKVNKRLSLNKSTVSHLRQEDMSTLKGGGDYTIITCYSYCYICTTAESFCMPCNLTMECK